MAEQISGVIERLIFHNPDNGFSVLAVEARGHRGPVTVVGFAPEPRPGEFVEATGAWVQNRDHGLQFKAEALRCLPPHTREGIIRYLGSGFIKGIGPEFARKIVDVFGDKTLAVLDENPAFLKEVKGLGRRRLERIRSTWQAHRGVRDLMVFLSPHGIGTNRILRIHKTYGDRALELVRANPYRLASEVWGIGFQTADNLAASLGIDRASPLRARAVISYLLQELSRQGHVCYPQEDLLDRARTMTEISLDILQAALTEAIADEDVVREASSEGTFLYLKSLYLAECQSARALTSLSTGKHPLPPRDMAPALEWVQRLMGIELATSQKEAITQATRSKVLVITGGPGVGKTTIVRGILEVFAAARMRCVLCAPTGRAAKRMQESTGREAKTIHRLLEFDPKAGMFLRNSQEPLEVDLVVVDEVSMVDIALLSNLLEAIPATACLVLVGDVDQLPSVGPGTVLRDLIASKRVPVVRLTEIFRQAGQSWIVRAAHAVQHGELPESAQRDQGDFYFVKADKPEEVIERILTLVCDRIPSRFGFDPMRDIQVLTPMNRTDLGVRNLNQVLQKALNPTPPGASVESTAQKFHEGDKVLQTVNNYKKEIFNGDVGRIAQIDDEEEEVIVDFDGRRVVYEYPELEELRLAFAMTVHKSQGSEYPAVVIPVHTQHFVMLQRNLLYTGITRGKKLVVLVGSHRALALAVERQDTSRRYTALRRRLQEL